MLGSGICLQAKHRKGLQCKPQPPGHCLQNAKVPPRCNVPAPAQPKGGAFTGDEKEFFRFVLGSHAVIPAFEEAVAGMKVRAGRGLWGREGSGPPGSGVAPAHAAGGHWRPCAEASELQPGADAVINEASLTCLRAYPGGPPGGRHPAHHRPCGAGIPRQRLQQAGTQALHLQRCVTLPPLTAIAAKSVGAYSLSGLVCMPPTKGPGLARLMV